LVLAEPRDDDLVIDADGHDSLHVRPWVNKMLAQAVLDKVETAQGPTLSIRPAGGRIVHRRCMEIDCSVETYELLPEVVGNAGGPGR
ncbi:MAG: hypothetical protein ACREOY_09600, partial [Candidatus Dormibacteraceae bacterium]